MAKQLKGTMQGIAKVTFSRNKSDGDAFPIHIEIRDDERKAAICEVHMSLEDFANALTGWARQPAVLYVNLDYDPEKPSDGE